MICKDQSVKNVKIGASGEACFFFSIIDVLTHPSLIDKTAVTRPD